MKILKIDFKNIPQLATTDRAYLLGDAALRPFYKYEVNLEEFSKVIENKVFTTAQRQVLVQELERQYANIDASKASLENIQKLRQDNCYSIITAHQPNLFTGPLYFIYKIISVLNLVQQLQKRYPNQEFVPVFWTGGEDHDFQEVNHLNLFGKRFAWEDEQGGAVGAYHIDSLRPILDAVKEVLGQGEQAQILAEALERFYASAADYNEAATKFVNWIFGAYGLVIANGNSTAFKKMMIPIFKEELLHQSSKTIVENTARQLEAAGFKQQAHVRDINLFYLSKNQRNRIVKEEDMYKILDLNLHFREAEILQELELHPEKFSPNVVLRPLFQETIFPNLAYIGGGGELAYWLERQAQFEHYKIPFPMLIRRSSVLWVESNDAKRLEKLGIEVEDLFEETENLIKTYITKNSEGELSFNKEQDDLNQILEQILSKTKQIDASLEQTILAQQAQIQKFIENLEQRLVRAEKKKNETSLEQIRKVKAKLFPGNGLQERHDNFLALYSRHGNLFLEVLMEHLNPLDKNFVVVIE